MMLDHPALLLLYMVVIVVAAFVTGWIVRGDK